MTGPHALEISFPNLSKREAGEAAAMIEVMINDRLREEGYPAAAWQHRTDERAADLGTVVQIILAAPATIILARGIAKAIQAYFSRTNRSSLSITKPDGTVITVTDLESRDIDGIAAKIS